MKKLLSLLLFSSLGFVSFGQKKDVSDSALFYELLNKHISCIQKKALKNNYYISNKLYTDSDTSERWKDLCSLYDSKININKNVLIKADTSKNNIGIYYILKPYFNSKLNEYVIYTSLSTGEWGGHMSAYHYLKKRKRWKLNRITLVSVS